ncbi:MULTISPECIES: chorismate mutase [unclassified Rhizobium]|jgi:chorismate mutase|uniref:chorismate mutase n=1 Tax=unclassified Rhizobium TaxID=2613769 RepID=UPI0009DF4791|nr:MULTISPECIES: chorismate mutase [unclassified Rhizobium]
MESNNVSEQLSSYRQTIDNIDAALVNMLAERFRCTDNVGILKAEHALPAADKDREKQQLFRLKILATEAGLDQVLVQEIMQFIIDKVVQRHIEIARQHQAKSIR